MKFADFNRYSEEIHEALKKEKIARIVNDQSYGWILANLDWLVPNFILNNTETTESNEVMVMRKKNDDKFIYRYRTQIFMNQWFVSDLNIVSDLKNVPEEMLRMNFDELYNRFQYFREHIHAILIYSVYSLASRIDSFNLNWPSYNMSGFVEQKGRLPTPKDEVKMYYLAGNSLKRWFRFSSLINEERAGYDCSLTSECCIVVK